jgi:cell shape-determining protein MreD
MNKTFIDLAALFVGVVLAFILQYNLPPMAEFHGAHVLLVPLVFCYAAMVLPFPAMLAAAFLTGFLSDLMYLHIVGGKVEIPIGFSIVYFVIFGCFANGFQPAIKSRNVTPFVVLSGVGTSLFLLLQFLAITLQRGGFIWEPSVSWRILAPGVMATLIAPLFYWTLSHMDRFIPDGSRKMRPIKR